MAFGQNEGITLPGINEELENEDLQLVDEDLENEELWLVDEDFLVHQRTQPLWLADISKRRRSMSSTPSIRCSSTLLRTGLEGDIIVLHQH